MRRGGGGQRAQPGGNRLRPGAKFDEVTLIRVAYCFCQGIPVKVAARSTGLSAKTVRGLYLDLRARLLKPAFNRWHGTNRMLTGIGVPEHEGIIRMEFFETMAACGMNETCRRNFVLGNRKARQCRSCPLARAYPDEARCAEAYAVIDAVHTFYEALGIRGEKGRLPVLLFRERLIHTTVIGSVGAESLTRDKGAIHSRNSSFLAMETLLKKLLFS